MGTDQLIKVFCLGEMGRDRPPSKHKNARSNYKMTYVQPNNKQTNIPDFQFCYPCKCLAHFARSPISNVLQDKW